MINTPLISVIVPLYNKEKWVKRCVDSVISQSYSRLEVLIVDDGSTDNSYEVVSVIKDSRIKIIRQANGGVSSARNKGLESAAGDYIAFIDADDCWRVHHLELLVIGFEKYPSASLVANRLEERRAKEEIGNENIHMSAISSNDCEYSVGDYLLWLSRDLFLFHIGSSMFRKSLLDEYNIRFFEHISLGEDINFMIRVSLNGKCILSNYNGLVYYRDDINSTMNQMKNKALLTPPYFYGMEEKVWTVKQHVEIIRFLRREYLKKAYQNRGLSWTDDELNSSFPGNIEIGKHFVLFYLLIRFTPEFMYSFYRKLKKFKR